MMTRKVSKCSVHCWTRTGILNIVTVKYSLH